MRAFDEARDVGHDVAFFVRCVANGDNAELWLEGGEGVVGDFGASCGDARDKRGLADVGIANEADVGENAEFKPVIAFFAGAAEFVLTRSLVRGSGKVLIAASAAACARDDNTLIGTGEIVDELPGIGVVKQRSNRNFQDGVFAVAAGAVGAQAVLAAFRFVLRVEAEIDQRVVALG